MKKEYLHPQIEIVNSVPFSLCEISGTDGVNKGEGNDPTIPEYGGDNGPGAARATWGNLWAEEEQDFYAYNAWE